MKNPTPSKMSSSSSSSSSSTTTSPPPPSSRQDPLPNDNDVVVVSAPNPTIEGCEEVRVEGQTLKMVEDLNQSGGDDDSDGSDGDDDGGDDVVVVTAPNPTIEGSKEGKVLEGETLKAPVEVVDLTGGDDDDNEGGSNPVGSLEGVRAMAVSMPGGTKLVHGGALVVRDGKLRGINDKRKSGVVEVVVKEKENKKPRLSDVNDPPIGTPMCSVCRELQSRIDAMGNLDKHPDRDRGFFKPPVSGSSSPSPPTIDVPSNDDDKNKGKSYH